MSHQNDIKDVRDYFDKERKDQKYKAQALKANNFLEMKDYLDSSKIVILGYICQ